MNALEREPTPDELLAMAYAEADKHSDAVTWQKRLIAEAGDEAEFLDERFVVITAFGQLHRPRPAAAVER